jgi:hypothetical protein
VLFECINRCNCLSSLCSVISSFQSRSFLFRRSKIVCNCINIGVVIHDEIRQNPLAYFLCTVLLVVKQVSSDNIIVSFVAVFG